MPLTFLLSFYLKDTVLSWVLYFIEHYFSFGLFSQFFAPRQRFFSDKTLRSNIQIECELKEFTGFVVCQSGEVLIMKRFIFWFLFSFLFSLSSTLYPAFIWVGRDSRVKTFDTPLLADFWRHCKLSVGTQHRLFLDTIAKILRILNI